jgi:hypothetical protein
MDITFIKKNPLWDKLDSAKRVALQEKKKIKEKIPEIPVQNLRRLLKDMEAYHIVQKKPGEDPSVKGPNKKRIFYRIHPLAAVRTQTVEGFKKEYFRLFSKNIDLSHKLIFASAVLSRHGLLKEYRDDLKKWEDGREKKG